MSDRPPDDAFSFAADDVWLSEFRLAPDHPRWNAVDATTGAALLLAFPRTTVGITQEARAEVVADPMSVIAYSPGQPYRRRLITAVGDDCTVLALTAELATDAARPFDSRTADPATYLFPFVAAPIARTAFATIQRLRHLVARAGEFSHDAVREELYWLVDHVMASGYGSRGAGSSAARAATTDAHRELAHAVIERVGRDVAANETLGELAATAFVSPFHMARIFRRATGQPIHAYRTELRLRASLVPIADGERLADVAQQVGFASHAHLTERFRRAYGISPVEWRAQLHRGRRETRKNMEARSGRALIA